MPDAAETPPPRLIAWEVTRQCPLACRHCRASAEHAAYEGEFTTDECYRLLDNVASFSRPTIILTGGEPLLRPDIFDIASHAHRLGLPAVLATCGKPLTFDVAARLKAAGIHTISISLDGATAEAHDAFRGEKGAFDSALRALDAARRAGLAFQINTTVTRLNRAQLPAIRDLAIGLGARVFNPFLLVPTGRGKELVELELSAQEYEETLHWLAEQEDRQDVKIRVTCAPHYQRIVRERRRDAKHAVRESAARIEAPAAPAAGSEHAGSARHGPEAKGCLGGKAFAFISHRGQVQICGFLDIECGDLRREGLDFHKIWETSEVLCRLRAVDDYHGRCGYCEYRHVCGGCRARAYALTGDYLAEEPFCVHQPRPRKARAEAPQAGGLDDLDRRLLTAIQAALPIDERPFARLAGPLGVTEADVLARLVRLKEQGLIRRLGPVFDSHRLGYASTLVAARVGPERLPDVARQVSALPGVTHCYERRAEWNLWFTLTARSPQEIDAILARVRDLTGIADLHSLPALAIYKIRVHFDLTGEAAPFEAAAPGSGPSVALTEEQQSLVRFLQDGLPLEAEPFAGIAKALGWTVKRVVDRVREWADSGVIRRFGAVVRHQTLGYHANGMAVFRVAEDRIDEAGLRLAESSAISHCYRRPPLPDFPYTLFAMVHGRTEDEVRALVDALAKDLGLPEHTVLFSATEFKKVSMRYFVE